MAQQNPAPAPVSTQVKRNGPAPSAPSPAPAPTAKKEDAPMQAQTEVSAEVKPKSNLSKEDKRKLFEAVFAAEREVSEAEKRIVELKDKVSEATARLRDAVGNGPFIIGGTDIRIRTKRTEVEGVIQADGSPATRLTTYLVRMKDTKAESLD